MADGKIRIDTKLNNDGVTKDVKDLNKMLEGTAKNLKKIFETKTRSSLKAELTKDKRALREQERVLEAYQRRVKNLDKEAPVKNVQGQIRAQERIIESAIRKIDNLKIKMESLESVRKSKEDMAIKNNTIGGGSKWDSPEKVKERANATLDKDAEYQKIINQEAAIADKMDLYNGKINEANSKIKDLKTNLDSAKSSQEKALNTKIDIAAGDIGKSKEKIDSLSNAMDKLKRKNDFRKQNKANENSFNKLTGAVKKFTDNLSHSADRGVKKLLKMGLAIFSIRSAYLFARRAANSYLESNQALANQVSAIWNVVAQSLGPVIQMIVGWVVTALSYISAFIKVLTGVDLVAKANAAALNKQAKATKGAGKAAEDAKRQLAKFDEMNVLHKDKGSKDSGGGGGANPIPTFDAKTVDVEGIKAKFMELTEPIRNAWTNFGGPFIDAFKFGLTEIWELTKSIGKSFEDIWLNGTGQLTCELILQILTNIFNTIGNIAKRFREAWDEAGLGTQIIQNLWGVLNSLLGTVNDITKSLSDWSSKLDFKPILQSVERLTKAFKPLADTIGGALKWAFDEVLEPLGKWVLEDSGPAGIKALANAIDLLNKVAESAKDVLQPLWDNFLSPIANWTGGVITEVLKGIGDGLKAISENEVAVTILGSLASALILVNGSLLAIKAGAFLASGAMGLLSGAFSVILSPIGLVVAGVAGLIAILVLCVKHWDEIKEVAKKVIDFIKEKFNDFVQWMGKTLKGVWDKIYNFGVDIVNAVAKIWNNITTALAGVGQWFVDLGKSAWDGLTNAFRNVSSFFGGVWSGIKSAFSSVSSWFKDTFSKAWQSVKDVFSTGGKIFTGIKDGILSGLKGVVNGIINGINKVVKVPFDGLNSALRTLKGVSILGLKPFGFLGSIGVPQIPRLARGGIVNNPGAGVNFGNFIAGEQGPEAIVPLSNSEFIKEFAQEVAKHVSKDPGGQTIILKVGDKEFFRWFIDMKKKYEFITNGG